MNVSHTPFRLAIQKSGRIGDSSREILQRAGFDFRCDDRNLLARVKSFPLEILFLRVGDIPEMIADGVVDFGILGKNTIAESSRSEEIAIVDDLQFSSCRLSLAVPNDSSFQSSADLAGKTIATSYERLLRKYLFEKNISANIVPISGSVEIAPKMRISDAICDIISSGSTLAANHLREIETIFSSTAVLAARKDFVPNRAFEEVLLRIRSVTNAKHLKSVVMNAPESSIEAISHILPGIDSPTITPLARKGWVALHSVVREDEFFWEKISQLKEAGASGILITAVDRVIF